ncbi:holin-like protein [Marinobacterium mangrovicola]|uniref:Holin-like protein n=2 Tax=Marinobacterium mangrovicola TaxID=1476959 RepID=A0A4V2PCY2_9GAMM|nr:holin-like protein [Marinobacterium mangrovicola]
MLVGLLILLGFQLAGELFVVSLSLPVPGPVMGMLFMAVFLLVAKRGVSEYLRQVADTLLSNLALLFVPAGVGLMVHLDLMVREWFVFGVTLVFSTAITMGVTGWVLVRLMRRFERGRGE